MKAFFENLYKGSKSEFLKLLKSNLQNGEKTFVVTANPEAFICAEKDSEMSEILKSATVVADGIGIVKGGKILGTNIAERIPGVEIAEELLNYANELNKSVYFFGAKPEVVKKLAETVKQKYTGIKIAGYCDGYCENKDKRFKEAAALSPDIILVALGIPAQEKLIYRHINEFNEGIFVGVGGSFDVLSGTKERAPQFFVKHNLEWLYRIVKEPKRLKRFYNNNIKFFFKLYGEK